MFTACLEKVCGPCEARTHVCRETGQGELGPTRKDGSRSLKIFVVFYFFVSLPFLLSWTYGRSSMKNTRCKLVILDVSYVL